MATASRPIQWLRTFLAGRKRKEEPLRYAYEQSARNVPPANLPGGAAHKLSSNYYYSRDGRRDKLPPELVAFNSPVALLGEKKAASKAAAAETAVGDFVPPTPGVRMDWMKSTTDAYPFGRGVSDHAWYYKTDKVDLHVRAPKRGTDLVGNK